MACPFIREIIDEEALLLRRVLRGERALRPRLDVLALPDDVLQERYRFTRDGLMYLLRVLGPHISHPTSRGKALKPEQTLCVALRFFASGGFLYSIGDAEHISKATACRAVRTVTLAIKRLLPRFVVFPSHKPSRMVKDDFHQIAGFPGVIGCIDGTHVPIISPPVNDVDFINRKSIHSINVQIICDGGYLITNVEAKWPGSVHDSRIFRESALCGRFVQGDFDGFLLGDRGYPCQPYLLTPYPDPQPGAQQRYNLAHSRTRTRVEMTIGMLKARFQCQKKLRTSPPRACDIIVACVVLHNIATIRGDRCPVHNPPEHNPHPNPEHQDARDGRVVRDSICNNHF